MNIRGYPSRSVERAFRLGSAKKSWNLNSIRLRNRSIELGSEALCDKDKLIWKLEIDRSNISAALKF